MATVQLLISLGKAKSPHQFTDLAYSVVLQTMFSALGNEPRTEWGFPAKGAGAFYAALAAEKYYVQQYSETGDEGREIRLGSNSRVLQEAKISTELNIQKVPWIN